MPEAKATKMSRDEIRAHIRKGEHVAVGAQVFRRDALTGRLTEPLPPLPAAAPDEDRPKDELEAVVVRDADGKLTRAGMEHAIRNGGSVLWGDMHLTSIDDLPTEEEIAAKEAKDARTVAASYDRQIAQLQQQKAQALERSEGVRDGGTAKASAKAEESDAPPGAHATREEWDDYAKSVGVNDPESLPNKDEVEKAARRAAKKGR